jgi:hypothetical protein
MSMTPVLISGRVVSRQTPPESSPKDAAATARPWSATWVHYYDRASRRRHRMGGYRRLRAEVKRKRRVERLAIVVAALGTLTLTGVFYMILSR